MGSLKDGDKTILNDTQAQNLLEMQEFMKKFYLIEMLQNFLVLITLDCYGGYR